MDIKLKKEENGSFITESKIEFGKGGCAMVSVDCDEKGCDEVLLRRETESQATIPVKVERGESARVKRLDFPVEVLPQEGKTH